MIFGGLAGASSLAAVFWLLEGDAPVSRGVGPLAAALGVLGVFASAMVYIDTRRPFWSATLVSVKFAATVLLLGAGLAACGLVVGRRAGGDGAGSGCLAGRISPGGRRNVVGEACGGRPGVLVAQVCADHAQSATASARRPADSVGAGRRACAYRIVRTLSAGCSGADGRARLCGGEPASRAASILHRVCRSEDAREPMSAPNVKHLAPRLRQWDGPLTAQLVCAPGRFGLGQVPARLAPAAVAKSICGFCSTGCGLRIHLDAHGQAINLTPDPEYPVNLGMACPKGWEALTPLAAADRATTPLLDGQPVDWTTAASTFAKRFKAIQARHGAASVAFLSSGQIMVEEMALLGAFAKFGMGVIHGDGNTRQCMATAVTAYKESFGFDAPPYTYDDFEESDVLVLVGSNLCVAHPIMWQRVMRNPHRPEIIVIDPRRTETANAATQHLDINPQADLTLFYCLAHWLVRHSKVDRRFIDAHTTGFEAFAEFLDAFPPEAHVTTLGISIAAFEKAAAAIAGGQRVSFWWTMGVNQGHQAVRTAQAIINLALMTGNIGRPGTGANSITGQCNAMGSRLFSNTTNLAGRARFWQPGASRENCRRAGHRRSIASRINRVGPMTRSSTASRRARSAGSG